jgi:hypothetical protein
MRVQDRLESVAVRVVARLEQTEIDSLIDAFERIGQIPREIDGQLLGGAREDIGRDLNSDEKKDIRRHFAEQCRNRVQ